MEMLNNRKVLVWAMVAAIGVVAVLLGCYFLFIIRSVLFLLFVGILLAVGFEPAVVFLLKGPINRAVSILVCYLILFGLLGVLFYFTLPPLLKESQDLVSTFSDQQSAKSAIANINNDFLKSVAQNVYQSAGNFIQASNLKNIVFSAGLLAVDILAGILSIFVIAFYWSTEKKGVKSFVLSFIPSRHLKKADDIWTKAEKKLGAWVRGQVLEMIFIGVIYGIGFWIMGLRFTLTLAFLAGLTDLLPIVGAYFGAAPAILVALSQSTSLAIIVLIFFIIVQQFEGNVLQPRIMQQAVGVQPLVVILALLAGAAIGGIGAALIAVPVTAVIQAVISSLHNPKQRASRITAIESYRE